MDKEVGFRRALTLVVLPFGAAYFCAYLFRNINAIAAPMIEKDVGLTATQVGLLTSIYFLACALWQLPFGALLDRFGPHRVQGTLMLVAVIGALLFSMSQSPWGLLVSRALIGTGVSVSLMAGLKAAALWVPRRHLGKANAVLIAFGGFGAMTVTLPMDAVVDHLGWRSTFVALSGLTLFIAIVLRLSAPPAVRARPDEPSRLSFSVIMKDPVFVRLAPLSASCLGSAWGIQGLWVSYWLAEVDGADRSRVTASLLLMAFAFCGGTILTGVLSDRVRSSPFGAQRLLGVLATAFILVQALLIARVSGWTLLLWTCFASFGGLGAVSFLVLADRFPVHSLGRANGLLNVMHLTAAFAVQGVIGGVVDQWPVNQNGAHPAESYVVAFSIVCTVQVIAVAWYGLPTLAQAWSRFKLLRLARAAGPTPRLP